MANTKNTLPKTTRTTPKAHISTFASSKLPSEQQTTRQSLDPPASASTPPTAAAPNSRNPAPALHYPTMLAEHSFPQQGSVSTKVIHSTQLPTSLNSREKTNNIPSHTHTPPPPTHGPLLRHKHSRIHIHPTPPLRKQPRLTPSLFPRRKPPAPCHPRQVVALLAGRAAVAWYGYGMRRACELEDDAAAAGGRGGSGCA